MPVSDVDFTATVKSTSRDRDDYVFDFNIDILSEIDAIAIDYPRVPKPKPVVAVDYFDITQKLVFDEEF